MRLRRLYRNDELSRDGVSDNFFISVVREGVADLRLARLLFKRQWRTGHMLQAGRIIKVNKKVIDVDIIYIVPVCHFSLCQQQPSLDGRMRSVLPMAMDVTRR